MKTKERFFTIPVIALIALTFFLGTSEYIIIGILPEIADSFEITITQAGRIVSYFAFAYGLGTPFLAALAGKYNRFRVTMGGIAVFAFCNLLCAITGNYIIFMFFRIIIAVISGTLVSISMTYADDIASPENVPKVVAGVFSGFSVASVFGVPIATTISNAFGWRAAFYCIFIATMILLVILYKKLPRQSKLHAQSALAQFLLFKDIRITCGCAIVFLGGVSVYTFYTYLTPIFETELLIPKTLISAALLIFGAGALISNVTSGHIASKSGLRSLPAIYFAQTIFLVLLPIATRSLILGSIDIFLISISMYLLNSPLQMHFLNTAAQDHPSCVNLASSLISVFFNFGIAAGSMLGGVIVDHAGLRYVGIGGAVFALAAAIFALLLLKIVNSASASDT